ncbi:exodeoxyribonuclease III [Prosthecodimorpha staleyi]|uniref:Exodeoxyribonuclease III n=1 Tax=Prosthecodimorpha staleyi TaxID=2840188 RepID=A0A947D7K3_9HYPH|nr:exodeoxyribonuclease III [Prosthecodimorpha staleyi]MBT9292426.1 exodeoxyribonuclease III [Prosthecodimorpha staleyi]
MARSFTLATWNINSVRIRTDLVERLAAERAPDVLCLQEIKCPEANFPSSVFRKLGYVHQAINGQKGYHGVAVLSRLPFAAIDRRGFCDKGDARHIAVTVDDGGDGVEIHNLYVPAGGDEPDATLNEKFAHKLQFLDEMAAWIGKAPAGRASIVVGDLNIAPLEHDVWSHKQLLGVVSHTPVETAALEAIRTGGGWVDAMRSHIPVPQKLYTWWSYRSADWSAADKGRRLDHVWACPAVAPRVAAIEVLRAARGWDRPSDHVPVIARIER